MSKNHDLKLMPEEKFGELVTAISAVPKHGAKAAMPAPKDRQRKFAVARIGRKAGGSGSVSRMYFSTEEYDLDHFFAERALDACAIY